MVAIAFTLTTSGLVFGSCHQAFMQSHFKFASFAEIGLLSLSAHFDGKTPFSGEVPNRLGERQ